MKKIKTLKLTANKFGLVNTKPVNRKKQVNNRLNPWSSKPIKIHSQNSKLSFGSKHKYNYNMSSTTRPTYHKRTKPIKMHFGFDTDRDGVKDHRDCRPFNPRKQHVDEGDWMDTEKRRPRKEKQELEDVPFEEFEEMTPKEKMGYFESLDNTLISKKDYKNYRIEFHRYPKGHKVGPYEGHPQTDIYLSGIVYAHGFEYDPTSQWGVKQGKVIGTGKTLEEAFRNAKQYIDKKSNFRMDKRTIERLQNKQKEFDKISSRLSKLVSIGARRKYTEREAEELIELYDRLNEIKDSGVKFE